MHKRLEDMLGHFGGFVHDNPFKVLLLVAVLLAFPISHISKIEMDTSTEGFMHEDDPVLLTYNKFRAQFGRDERIILAIEDENIFSIDFLTKLRNLHRDIEKSVPYLDDVTSLYNVRNTRGKGDQLITDDLLEPFPKTAEDVANIKKRAMESHFYRDLFLSRDGKMTTIVIETDAYSHEGEKKVTIEDEFSEGFDDNITQKRKANRKFLTDQENHQILEALQKVTDKYKKEGLKIYIAGSPAVNNQLKAQMRSDIQKFMRITFLIILIFLFIVFKRITAVLYPLLVIVLSLLATVGTMAWSGTPFKLPTQIVPSLLIVVSVGATVHILSIFFDEFNKRGDKREALSYTLKHSGLAIAMTSITTAIGIGSFSGSAVAPISDLGIFASLGVMISLFLTLTLLPALLAITKLKPKRSRATDALDEVMRKLATIPIKYTKSVLIVSAIFVILALIASFKVQLSHNPLKWFQPDVPIRLSTEIIDNKMNGSVTIELVVDTGKVNGWQDPDRLKKLNELSAKLEKYKDEYTHIGKVVSLATIVKETNRALHENREEYYTIPTKHDLVSQELLLFENSGSDDLEDVVDSQFSKARITIKLPWQDAIHSTKVLAYVTREAKKTFTQDRVETTGMTPLLVNTFSQAIHSSIVSYIIAGIGITLMMMLILGSFRLGLLSMVPNITPIIMGLLVMYIRDIPLDMFTLLIGSIAIGLAVDDTIHFMHNFKRYYMESGDSTKAIEQTFFTTGKAMVITSLVLSLGFFAYLAANMISVQNFGMITGSVILFALFADLMLAPALIIVVAKKIYKYGDN